MDLLIQKGSNATPMIIDALNTSLQKAVMSKMTLPECYNVLHLIVLSPLVKTNLDILAPFVNAFGDLTDDIKKAIGISSILNYDTLF